MNTKSANNAILGSEDNFISANFRKTKGEAATGIAHQLRALGQALEKFNFDSFELDIVSGSFQVIGRTISNDNNFFSMPRSARDLVSRSFRHPRGASPGAQVDLRFSPQDIDGFDLHGRSQRHDVNKKPEQYSISQILRSIGSYSEHKHGVTLIGISLNGKQITTRYETLGRQLEQVDENLEYYYRYWAQMYLDRSNRKGRNAIG